MSIALSVSDGSRDSFTTGALASTGAEPSSSRASISSALANTRSAEGWESSFLPYVNRAVASTEPIFRSAFAIRVKFVEGTVSKTPSLGEDGARQAALERSGASFHFHSWPELDR